MYYQMVSPVKRSYWVPTLRDLSAKVEAVRSDCLAWHRYGRTYQVPDAVTYRQALAFLRRCLLARRCSR